MITANFAKPEMYSKKYCKYIIEIISQNGNRLITMKGSEGHKLCPVRALCLYAKQRGRVPGPPFVHNDNSFVSIFQFNAVLKSVLKLALPGCNSIKSHSFRIGGATNAIARGIPYEDVQIMGRWRSHAAKKYIRVQEIDVARLV